MSHFSHLRQNHFASNEKKQNEHLCFFDFTLHACLSFWDEKTEDLDYEVANHSSIQGLKRNFHTSHLIDSHKMEKLVEKEGENEDDDDEELSLLCDRAKRLEFSKTSPFPETTMEEGDKFEGFTTPPRIVSRQAPVTPKARVQKFSLSLSPPPPPQRPTAAKRLPLFTLPDIEQRGSPTSVFEIGLTGRPEDKTNAELASAISMVRIKLNSKLKGAVEDQDPIGPPSLPDLGSTKECKVAIDSRTKQEWMEIGSWLRNASMDEFQLENASLHKIRKLASTPEIASSFKKFSKPIAVAENQANEGLKQSRFTQVAKAA